MNTVVDNVPCTITKVTVASGDLVVLSTDLAMDKAWLDAAKATLKTFFPNNEVMVLTAGMKLSVIERAKP